MSDAEKKNEFVVAASPVAKLIGHSLACSLGFVGLVLVSLIPIGALKAVAIIGVEQLAEHLHFLEQLLLAVDIGLFSLVFLAGVVSFAAEVLAEAKQNVINAFQAQED